MWFCKKEKYVPAHERTAPCYFCGGIFKEKSLSLVSYDSRYTDSVNGCQACAKPYKEKEERRKLIIQYIESHAEEEEQLYQKAKEFADKLNEERFKQNNYNGFQFQSSLGRQAAHAQAQSAPYCAGFYEP